MEEGKERNVGDPNSLLSENPEDSGALQMLRADDVLAVQFDSLAAAESFNHKYASAVGFIVRKDDMVTNKQGEDAMRRWVCDREGSQQRKHLVEDANHQVDPMPLTRVDCPASFHTCVDRVCHKWLVREFVADHTHELAPACGAHLQIDQPVLKSENVQEKGLIGVEGQPIQGVVDCLPREVDCDWCRKTGFVCFR